MNTTLLIMAAGIGSRFGGGIKQLTPVGPNKEIIMDYSIHDAIDADHNNLFSNDVCCQRTLEKTSAKTDEGWRGT